MSRAIFAETGPYSLPAPSRNCANISFSPSLVGITQLTVSLNAIQAALEAGAE
ncbi:MAG: hypothetical protein ACD_39C00301G0002, partial [uncultured bacterium]